MYKGIIFNSVTVRMLTGALAEYVRKNHIRTAVVSNHGRTEVRERLASAGVSVDVTVGKFDLDRYGQLCKPARDPMVVAVAQMGLEPSEVICVADCPTDRLAATGAGIDLLVMGRFSEDELIRSLGSNPAPEPDGRDYGSFSVPVRGIMGCIVGDTLGSRYEHSRTTDYNFKLFPSGSHPTDDSLGTLAVARWLLGDRSRESLERSLSRMVNCHPRAGWSHRFRNWARSSARVPYGAVTNGSAMRVSACGWAAGSLDEALDLARRSAEVSHNSPEGIAGAQATAACIYLARTGHTKAEVKKYIEDMFGYDLDMTVAEHRRRAVHEYTCAVSVPQAIRCWLESDTYEQTVRSAISIGYDADTVGAIAGSIAAATPGMEVPQAWADRCFALLKEDLRQIFYDFTQSMSQSSNREVSTDNEDFPSKYCSR